MKKIAATMIGLLAPVGVSAQVVITEVMYDLPGSDSGREWVEVRNTGDSSVDLADWRFFEQDTNHRFQNEGDVSLAAGSRAIIADDVNAFEADHPNAGVLILNSSFSLKNTGEYIALKNADGEIVDEITYTPQADADGEGASLQLISGSWGAYQPTPGEENAAEEISSDDSESNDNNDQDTSETQDESGDAEEDNSSTDTNTNTTTDTETVDSTRPVPPEIYAFGGEDRTVIVGADVVFEGDALGVQKEPLENAQYIWNFGDGATAEGQTVTHHFSYPGTYIVVVTVVSGELSTSDHVRVTAEPSDILISDVSGNPEAHIAISNDAHRDVHIGNWYMQTNTGTFQFPPETYIARGGTLTLPKRTTGLSPEESQTVRLLYPNTNVAFVYPEDLGTSPSGNETTTEQSKLQDATANHPAASQGSSDYTQPRTRVAQKSTETKDTAGDAHLAQGQVESAHTQTASTPTTSASTTNTVMVIESNKSNSDWNWILGLIALILLSLFGIGFMRYKEATASKEEQIAREADEYAIIEDKE